MFRVPQYKCGGVVVAGERTLWQYASECPRLPPDPQIWAMLFLFRDLFVNLIYWSD